MISRTLKTIGKENSWYKSKDSVFGLYKNYFFILGDSDSSKFLLAPLDELDDQIIQILNQSLAAKQKSLKIKEYTIVNNELRMRIISYKKDVLYAVLNFLADLFASNNLSHQNKCHNCGNLKDLGYYSLPSGLGIIYCTSCFEGAGQMFNEAHKRYSSEKKNYLSGTFGAFLYTIPVMIIYVIIWHYVGIIAGFMALLFGIASLKGYTDFKGKPGSFTVWIMLLVNVVSIVAANYLTAIYSLYQKGVSIGGIFELLLTSRQIHGTIFIGYTFMSFVVSIFPLLFWLYAVHSRSKLGKMELAGKIE
jgi:hypothetical protein